MGCIGPSKHILPGDVIGLAEHCDCSYHKGVAAVSSIATEVDSFGCETVEVCQECVDAHNERLRQQRLNPDPALFLQCESCGTTDKTVKPTRDPEEGGAGPLYDWCGKCRAEVFSNWN